MSPRERRAVRLGGTIVLAAVLALRVLPAVFRMHAALRLRASQQMATLARARATVAAARAGQDSFQVAARAMVALAPRFLAGASEAEAAANLTAQLTMVANRAGLEVAALNLVPDSARGTFVPIVLRGEVAGDITGVAHFLGVVERSPVVLSLRSLVITAEDPFEQQPRPERLRVAFVMSGWRLNRAGP